MKNEDIEYNEDEDIVGWCIYCKEPIQFQEEYVVKGKDFYHLNCYNQLTQYSEDYGTNTDEYAE